MTSTQVLSGVLSKPQLKLLKKILLRLRKSNEIFLTDNELEIISVLIDDLDEFKTLVPASISEAEDGIMTARKQDIEDYDGPLELRSSHIKEEMANWEKEAYEKGRREAKAECEERIKLVESYNQAQAEKIKRLENDVAQ